jgi:hypothetical protein
MIDLTMALHNPQEVRLSEFVDSISFVVLETTPQSNLSDAQLIRFSGDYIMAYDKFFNWSGKYLGRIGQVGRGPLETLWPVSNAIHVGEYFYALGEKLLQFDLKGRATGKVRELNSPFDHMGILLDASGFSWADDNFVTYSAPDSVYFIDCNFQIIDGRQVSDMAYEKGSYYDYNGEKVTEYDGKPVFYNFHNDTIFHVSGTRLDPKWVVSLSKDLKPGPEFFYERLGLLHLVLAAGTTRGSEYERISKGKVLPVAAYETDNYVIMLLQMQDSYWDSNTGGVIRPEPFITYFVKNTGETVRVAGNGFADDILGLSTFYPQWGIWEEKMITSIWPYELHDLVAERRRAGEIIAPRLETLAASVRTSDNPILIVAHLKRVQ